MEPKLGRHPNAVLIALFLSVYLVYALSPVTTSTDSAWTFHLAASILRQGNIDLDEYRGVMNLPLEYRVRIVNGHIYYYYPAAVPLLVTPIVWIVNIAFPLHYPTDFFTYLSQHAPDERTAKLEKLIASGIAALAAVLMYLIGRQYLGILRSILLLFIFAFATSMWSTASRALWQHGPSALFLELALYLIILAKQKEALLAWTGPILGFTYLIRPTNSLSVAVFGLYILINHRKYIWHYAAGVLAVLIPFIAYNWFLYGNVFPPYSYQLFDRLATVRIFAEGLAGTLISPARGLFIFTPVFLFSVYVFIFLIRQKRISIHGLELYVAAIILSHWIIVSSFEDWGGAWSIGPRYFAEIVPFLTYLLIPLLQGDLLTMPAWKYTFIAAVFISLLIQFHCSTSVYPWMWNGKPIALVDAPERKWDWGDLQFLRGLCKEDPLEGRAPACWLGND
jgi:hypothetical protein